jgi:hypothetical protein
MGSFKVLLKNVDGDELGCLGLPNVRLADETDRRENPHSNPGFGIEDLCSAIGILVQGEGMELSGTLLELQLTVTRLLLGERSDNPGPRQTELVIPVVVRIANPSGAIPGESEGSVSNGPGIDWDDVLGGLDANINPTNSGPKSEGRI